MPDMIFKKVLPSCLHLCWIFLLIFGFIGNSCKKFQIDFPEISGLQKIEDYEGGFLYKTNSGKFHVISLNGNYLQMGRQYGYLLGGLMKEYHQEVEKILREAGISESQMNSFALSYYNMQPYPFKQMMDGMAMTSKLSVSQQRFVCSSMSMMYEVWPGCSSIQVWKNYSKDRKMICGRNWDAQKGRFDHLGKYLVVVLFNPGTHAQSVAEFNYVGSFSPQTLINEKGIYLDAHACQLLDTISFPGRLPAGYLLFSFLLNSTNMDDLSRYFSSTRPAVSLLVNAAVAEHACCFQWPTFDLHKREADSAGLLVSTNHFIGYPKEWPLLPIPKDPEKAAYTIQRFDNLMELAWQNKGGIDAEKMMTLMELTIPNRGAAFPDNDPRYETYYQIVTVPQDLIWYVKAVNYSGWEKIPLIELFR